MTDLKVNKRIKRLQNTKKSCLQSRADYEQASKGEICIMLRWGKELGRHVLMLDFRQID